MAVQNDGKVIHEQGCEMYKLAAAIRNVEEK
jgi:hypothetical protein